jgi:hypothetical protein
VAPFAPCTCGGTLVGDLALGIGCLVHETSAVVLGGVFGGLRAITGHASGSFAKLECAVKTGCCGGYGCGMPTCTDCCDTGGYTTGEYIDSGASYAPAIPMPSSPELAPTPAAEPAAGGEGLDPFVDDPESQPQARRLPQDRRFPPPGRYGRLPTGATGSPVEIQRARFEEPTGSGVRHAAHRDTTSTSRYLPTRLPTLRRGTR